MTNRGDRRRMHDPLQSRLNLPGTKVRHYSGRSGLQRLDRGSALTLDLPASDVERLVKGSVLPGGWDGCWAWDDDAVRVGAGSVLVAGGGERSRRRGWPRVVVGTTRRGGVDRLAATLMFAGRDRRSVMRRRVPLTRVVSGMSGGHRSDGDRSCNGGAPARRDDGVHFPWP